MHSLKYWGLALFLNLFLFLRPLTGYALHLQAETQTAIAGESVSIEVTVGGYDQQQIAATAFTLQYDTDYLTLTGVDSAFFTTFENQWNLIDPVPDPLPPTSVDVDGQAYTQPLLFQTIPGSPSGKTMVAAARVKAGTPTNLLTFHFTVNSDAPTGEYPLVLSPTILNNTDAGYDPEGEAIPILYDAIEGETDLTLAYPSYTPDLINGAIVVQAGGDTDNDGIDDTWELTYFENLTIADADSDYDQDGLKDVDEFGYNTNPKLKDSDGDGVDDATEAALGSNPTNGQEFARRLHTGYNLVAIPADVSTQPDLKEWLVDLGINGLVNGVMAYDTVSGTFSSFSASDSYALTNDEGIVIQADSDAIISFTSLDCMSVDLAAGLNIAGFTCAPADFSAYDLLTALGNQNASSVQRFNSTSGAFETAAFDSNRQPQGVDFPIMPGEGYFVYMRASVSNFNAQ